MKAVQDSEEVRARAAVSPTSYCQVEFAFEGPDFNGQDCTKMQLQDQEIIERHRQPVRHPPKCVTDL